MPKVSEIQIRGARANNLKNIDLNLPRSKFIVITGVSGSGKSSLAFDTIYAEGRRRYMDTLSQYARYFMGILEKPEVESITGLSPIIAIEQKTTGNNPRSTVGTITEISDFLRLLFAKAATAYSPTTGLPLQHFTDAQIVDLIMEQYQGRKCLLLSPLVRGRKGHYRELFEQLRKKGYAQVRIDDEIHQLDQVESVDRYKAHFIELVVDKLKPEAGDDKRIRTSVASAITLGKGSVSVLDVQTNEIRHYSKHLVDTQTGLSLREPAPHSFSFNSPEGYCPHCKGLGTVVDVNFDTIIPNTNLSIAEGGFTPLGKIRETKKFELIRSMARKHSFSLNEPINELPKEIIDLIIYGSDEYFRIGQGSESEMETWSGLVEDIEDRIICPECGGSRLNPNTHFFKIDGKTITDVSNMEISELHKWINSLPDKLDFRANAIAHDIIRELKDRVQFLLDVGLDYLCLNRSSTSLSGGEGQRIRLATQIGSKLVNVIYVLDEPSIGLHQRDNYKLINSLKRLRDEGNTVIVVEHDEQTIRSADWIVDIGPGAGAYGGEVVYNGPECHFVNTITIPQTRRSGSSKSLILKGASGNNLKNIDVSFPLGCFIGISGLSGSGKSTLINQTLMPILKRHFYTFKTKPLAYNSIEGLENIDKVVEIDQSPIGKSARSNPATYTGVFTDIRSLFEDTPDAKIRGFKAGKFSFNVSGGRCEECKGAGLKQIEMNFLPSVNVVCPVCRGRRYNEDVLAVKYKGKNISEVLDMPISEAHEFFRTHPKIAPKLKALVDVGLGYVQLGQSSLTLSGGECQRMKLASEFFKRATGNTLYMLDEPTTGLSVSDIQILLDVLQKLVDQGNTVIIIEHNLDILKNVDYLIDMGPEGGERGGKIIAQGTPEEIAANPQSETGKFLKEIL